MNEANSEKNSVAWIFYFKMWGKSSRGALGGAVKQLAFDSTALVKTNMADGEGGGGGYPT